MKRCPQAAAQNKDQIGPRDPETRGVKRVGSCKVGERNTTTEYGEERVSHVGLHRERGRNNTRRAQEKKGGNSPSAKDIRLKRGANMPGV